MMKFKKFLAAAMMGTMMFGMVAAALPVSYAYAAETEVYRNDITLSFDYEDLSVTVSSEKDTYIKLEVLKLSGETIKGVGSFYSYKLENGTITIDLSFLSLSKDCMICVRGDSDLMAKRTEPVKIAKQEKKPSIKYGAQEDSTKPGSLSIKNSFTLRGADFDPALYQYKPLYGTSWNNMSELPIDTLSIAGTTLMIRKAFVETAGSENVASAEAKVKIAAAPKAPKATVDYKKGVVTIPNKTEYKVIYASGENDSASTTEASMKVTETPLYVSTNSGNTQITADNVATYFDVSPDGTVTLKEDSTATFYSDKESTTPVTLTTDNIPTYITGIPASTSSSATMTETAAWKPVSTKVSLSPKNILKESGITDPETQDKLLESGFIVAIRTAYDGQKKKAASSINFVTIGETAKSETIEGEDGIKVGEATFKWAFGDNDKVTFTATNGVFEYADSEDSTRWTKVSGSKTVSVTSGTTIYVRRMGDKASSLLPSDITPVKLEKAEKPAAVANVTVSVKDGESTTVTKPTDTTSITVEFVATVTDTDGAELTGQTITWKLDDASSTDAGVTLDKTTGSITITKEVTVEEVTVTATAGEKSGSCKITIQNTPAS